MFRVVPDQLRISEGWVRCGHCDEVFDANAHLRTLEEPAFASSQQAESLPVQPTSRELPLQAAHEPQAAYDWGSVIAPPVETAQTEPLDEDAPVALEDFDPLQPHEPFLDESLASDVPSAPGYKRQADPFLEQSPHGSLTEELSEPLGVGDAEAQGAWVHAMEAALAQSDVQADPGATAAAMQAPLSFMPQSVALPASRRWPGNKTMALLCLLLALVLAAQLMVLERDRIAARVPALRPLLLGVCELLACAVTAPQQIEAIAIESSAFTSLRPGVYMLSVSLKNAATIALAAPALELTLTDIQDQPLVRKVLLAQDFSSKPQIAAGSELSASVPISVQQGAENQKVAGYKLLAFYP
jgi:predicted Zn finger-like uncharacterized protein